MIPERRIDEPHISIVTRSGATTENDKEVGKKEIEHGWVRKAVEKSFVFDIQKEKKVFMEEKRSFMDAVASTSREQQNQNNSCGVSSSTQSQALRI